jgi:hypothetical protein
MKTAIEFRGCTLTQTETTTDVIKVAFGRKYQTVARVWDVTGRVTKDACARPFLTSAAAAREYVRDELALRAE